MNHTGHRRSAWVQQQLALLLSVLTILCVPAAALARKHRSREKAANSASNKSAQASRPPSGPLNPSDIEPPPAGEQGAPDYEALSRQLEGIYRQAPNPELLYQMGVLAKLLGKGIEAQDLMRRYLADPLTQPTSEGREEAERVVALPRPACGEVQVVADQEGQIKKIVQPVAERGVWFCWVGVWAGQAMGWIQWG